MSEQATDAAAHEHARQRRRSLITLAVVLLGLFFAFWYAWSYYQAEQDHTDDDERATPPLARQDRHLGLGRVVAHPSP